MTALLNKSVILWDFDGIIIDSNQVREHGFKEVFKEYPSDKVNELLAYHKKNGGLSRYVKIKYFFEELLESTISDEGVMKMADSFSVIMKEELIKPAYIIKNTMDFIVHHFQIIDMHIVSGSDQEELRYLCQSLGIKKYFKSINGSPTHKNVLVADLLKSYNYDVNEVILIGDSINDYEAALANDVAFSGYNNIQLKEKGNYIEQFSC